MHYNPDDTIAAIGTAAGGAMRGMVRLSGPRVLECLASCFSAADTQLSEVRLPQVISGSVSLGRDDSQESLQLPCDVFLWPNDRSYTRQPTAELHTLGSPPLLEQLLRTVCDRGARLAQPGEFTLRAFLAGRLDLTQAEAVLGVIDAHSSDDLHSALAQLAGGLSQPLALLREKLLYLLAELEAGLDFAEEDIEFITAEQLRDQLTAAQTIVAEVAAQLTSRGAANDLPRVVLSGLPNAGKSSLFNAIVTRYAKSDAEQQALVSPQSGTTRDFITAVIEIEGLACELVDTAGIETIDDSESIDGRAQELSGREFERASLVVQCEEASTADAAGGMVGNFEQQSDLPGSARLAVLTKSDLLAESKSLSPDSIHCSSILCSSADGSGLETLAQRIYEILTDATTTSGGSLTLTATRCNESLHHAEAALTRALQLVEHRGGEELIAAETREALHALGQIVGAVYTDDILDRIFSQFCIGK